MQKDVTIGLDWLLGIISVTDMLQTDYQLAKGRGGQIGSQF